MNSALRRLVSGQMPAMTGMRNTFDAAEKFFQQAKIEDGLSDGVFRARLNFEGKAADFIVEIGNAGIGGDSYGEAGGFADGIAADIQSIIQAAHDVDEADGVHIENGGGVRIVAEFRRIAGEAEKFFNPMDDAPSRSDWMLSTLRSRQV